MCASCTSLAARLLCSASCLPGWLRCAARLRVARFSSLRVCVSLGWCVKLWLYVHESISLKSSKARGGEAAPRQAASPASQPSGGAVPADQQRQQRTDRPAETSNWTHGILAYNTRIHTNYFLSCVLTHSIRIQTSILSFSCASFVVSCFDLVVPFRDSLSYFYVLLSTRSIINTFLHRRTIDKYQTTTP